MKYLMILTIALLSLTANAERPKKLCSPAPCIGDWSGDNGGVHPLPSPMPIPRPPGTFPGLLPILYPVIPVIETETTVPSVSVGQPSAQYFEILAEIEAKSKVQSTKWWSDRGIEQTSLLDFLNNIFK